MHAVRASYAARTHLRLTLQKAAVSPDKIYGPKFSAEVAQKRTLLTGTVLSARKIFQEPTLGLKGVLEDAAMNMGHHLKVGRAEV